MIASYLNATAERLRKKGHDVHGVPLTASAETIKVRFQTSNKRLTDGTLDQRSEYMVDAEMWIMPDQDMENDDVITFDGKNYKVARVDIKRGLSMEIDHKKCLLVLTKE